MRRLCYRGSVDFSKADLLDRHWWIYLRSMMSLAEDELWLEVVRLRHMQHLFGTMVFPADIKGEEWDAAAKLLSTLYQMNFPWDEKIKKDSKEAVRDKNVDSLQRQWTEIWGDMRDPETQQRIRETVESLDRSNTRKRGSRGN